MHLRSLAPRALCAVSLLLAACQSGQQSKQQPAVPTASLVRPITNGSLDSTHAAVVYIQIGDYAACTGTLITPNVVMTAAHCVFDENGNQQGPEQFAIGFGTYVGSSMTVVGVTEVQPHPSYSPNNYPYDVALMRLDRSVTNVTPIPYLPASLQITAADVNSTNFVFSGYGITESGSAPGERLKVSDTIGYVCTSANGCRYLGQYAAPYTICYDQQPGGPCSGDSGGPAFVVRNGHEYVAGVTSYGDESCQTYGCSTKVDVFEDFIRGFIGGGSSSDKPLGDSCTAANECASGFCADGVCCNSACNGGACYACSRAAGASSNGLCAPRSGSCDDGNRCTTNDTCSNGVCRGDAVTCSAPDSCHISNGCNPDTGACTYSAAADGTSCDDSNPCTLDDACAGGVCTGTPNTCEPADSCHQAGVCDAVTGECVNPAQPDGTGCGDGKCKAGVCEASGCGCSSSAGMASWALFFVPALALRRRRRA